MSQQYTSRTAALKAITIDASKVRIKEKIGAPTYTNVADLINSKVSKKDFEYNQIDNASEHASIWGELDTKATRGDISDAISEINKEIDYKINEITSLTDTAINDSLESIENITDSLSTENILQNNIINTVAERYTSFNTASTTFNSSIESYSSASASSFRFSGKHCPNGIIKEIRLTGATSAASATSESTPIYLIAKIYEGNNLISSNVSTNKTTTTTGTNNYSTWYFENLISPAENQWIKFCPSLDGITHVSGVSVRVSCDDDHGHDGCGVGGDTYDDSNPVGSTNKWLTLCTFVGEFYSIVGVFSHINDIDSHLAPYEKTFLNNISNKTNSLVFNNNIDSVSTTRQVVKGFNVGRPYITNGVFTRIGLPFSGTASTSNVTLIIDIKDTRSRILKTIKSTSTWSYAGTSTCAYWNFDPFKIDDNVGYLQCHVSTDGGANINPNAQIVVMSLGSTGGTGSEMTNTSHIPHIHFFAPELTFKSNLVDTSAGVGDYINVHGQMTAVPATTITNMNAWLREQVNPLRETHLPFNDVVLGSANETTHVYFNDLRTVGCPQLFSTATISGTVVIHLPVLETIGDNTIFGSLTLNGDLYVEVPHYDYSEIYVADNNDLTNNGGNIYITAPPHITAAATR